MKILIYKRTHTGDPDRFGRFGIRDCMGKVRSFDFDAVIGVGGIGAEPISQGIAGKVTWVGVEPKSKFSVEGYRAPVVQFKSFVLLDQMGFSLQAVAPSIARRLYEKRARYIIVDDTSAEIEEVREIMKLAFLDSSNMRFGRSKRSTRRRLCKTNCKKRTC